MLNIPFCSGGVPAASDGYEVGDSELGQLRTCCWIPRTKTVFDLNDLENESEAGRARVFILAHKRDRASVSISFPIPSPAASWICQGPLPAEREPPGGVGLEPPEPH